MNLYSKLTPAGRLIFVDQSGFAVVYWLADSAGADAAFQLPSWAIEPTILTVWPNDVVVFELNVTATVDTGDAQPVGAAVEVEVAFVEDAGALLEAGGVEPPEPLPVILMSAQVR